MYKVLQTDGLNLMTDKGGVCLGSFAYADGGKTHPMDNETVLKVRDCLVHLPDLLDAVRTAASAAGKDWLQMQLLLAGVLEKMGQLSWKCPKCGAEGTDDDFTLLEVHTGPRICSTCRERKQHDDDPDPQERTEAVDQVL
jgi:hypothetical protein